SSACPCSLETSSAPTPTSPRPDACSATSPRLRSRTASPGSARGCGDGARFQPLPVDRFGTLHERCVLVAPTQLTLRTRRPHHLVQREGVREAAQLRPGLLQWDGAYRAVPPRRPA